MVADKTDINLLSLSLTAATASNITVATSPIGTSTTNIIDFTPSSSGPLSRSELSFVARSKAIPSTQSVANNPQTPFASSSNRDLPLSLTNLTSPPVKNIQDALAQAIRAGYYHKVKEIIEGLSETDQDSIYNNPEHSSFVVLSLLVRSTSLKSN